jgi:C4-type Zn-finger protein
MREPARDRIEKRGQLFKEQGCICGYCKKKIEGAPELEHIIPVILGGSNDISNQIVTCKKCNYNKHDYIIFSLIEDRELYPVLDIPFFFRVKEIQSNGYKDNKLKRALNG